MTSENYSNNPAPLSELLQDESVGRPNVVICKSHLIHILEATVADNRCLVATIESVLQQEHSEAERQALEQMHQHALQSLSRSTKDLQNLIESIV